MARRHYLHPRLKRATKTDRLYWTRRRERLFGDEIPATVINPPGSGRSGSFSPSFSHSFSGGPAV